MRKFRLWAGAVFMFMGLALAVRAGEGDDKSSRDIVARAIKAHGGAKNLKKARAAQVKASGTLDFMNGIKFSSETFTQDPDKFKNIVEININNMNITINQVFNGKNFWMKVADQDIESRTPRTWPR
jgi:hypothetical protein